MNNIESLKAYFSAELILTLGIIVLVVLSLRPKEKINTFALSTAIVVLALALLAQVETHFTGNLSLFKGMMALDPMGQFFKILITMTALVAVVMSSRSRDLEGAPRTEFLAFLMALTLSLCVMAVSNDLIMIYLTIEMASIFSYVLAAWLARDKRSEEAGLKYVLYGGMASGVMLFGLSLLYGLTGTLNLIEIREYLMTHATDRLVLFVTLILILTGLGYKMAVAPFHMWSPDVYEGAPIAVTAFLSVASKAAGFAVTLRFFSVAFIVIDQEGHWSVLKSLDWQVLMAALSAVTMTIGNVIALQQTNIKRFLAYSSITHAGYMLAGVAVQSVLGIEAIAFYFMVYFLMNLGAFLVATWIANEFHTEEMADYRGLARQNRLSLVVSLCFTVFLLSLAGIPPFAGFIAKWYVFRALIDSGLIWLAVVGAVNAVISLFYYVKLVKYMTIDEPQKEMRLTPAFWRFPVLVILFAFLSVYFGIYFDPLAEWAKNSAVFLY